MCEVGSLAAWGLQEVDPNHRDASIIRLLVSLAYVRTLLLPPQARRYCKTVLISFPATPP
jgi:hypothetical protein